MPNDRVSAAAAHHRMAADGCKRLLDLWAGCDGQAKLNDGSPFDNGQLHRRQSAKNSNQFRMWNRDDVLSVEYPNAQKRH